MRLSFSMSSRSPRSTRIWMGKALAAFDGGADVLAADGDFHGIQHILRAEAVACHGGAIDFDVQIGFPLHTGRGYSCRSGNR
jgi:hypothetical protein